MCSCLDQLVEHTLLKIHSFAASLQHLHTFFVYGKGKNTLCEYELFKWYSEYVLA